MKLIYQDLKNRMPYQKNDYKKSHNGQLKLLMTEIQFFNNINIRKLAKKEKLIVLCIGSGKGFHFPVLIDFLNIKNIVWYFFDPQGHCDALQRRADNKTIFIYNECFDNTKYDIFKKLKNIILISDIRTKIGDEVRSIDIINDTQLQNEIVFNIKPIFSLLKFRFPYPDDWNPKIEDVEYPNGIMYLQAYAPIRSTETRLFIPSVYSMKKFNRSDALEYEEKFFFFNTKERKIYKNNKLVYNNDYEISKDTLIKSKSCKSDSDVYNMLKKFIQSIENNKHH